MSSNLPEPELTPEPGWTALTDLMAFTSFPSFVSGEPHGDRIRVRYYRRDSDKAVVGKAWFGHLAEGPPGHAHGGAAAALLDEAMGFAGWLSGHTVVAVKLTVNFRQLVPLGKELLFEGQVVRVDGRKITTRGRLFDRDDNTLTDAEGLFLNLEFGRLGLPISQLPDRSAE